MATRHTLSSDGATTDALPVNGWESFVFFSGDFDGGFCVTEFSPNGSDWFADPQLTFSKKGFETFRGAPAIKYRFRLTGTNGSPSVNVDVA